MTSLIDADSIIYILAYQYRDETEIAEPALTAACDNFVHSICTRTQSDSYVGVFSSTENFRHELYKYKPYKGNRPPKPEFIVKWADTIRDYLMSKWNFYRSPNLEADDVIAALSVLMEDTIICSPDKDPKQMPGLHYNYSKDGAPELITPLDATFRLWSQVLIGDTSDNIAGLPGLGEKKVKALFEAIREENADPIVLKQMVADQYSKYFGEWYGPIIFSETLQTVMLVRPEHPMWDLYKDTFHGVIAKHTTEVPSMDTELTELIDDLGWPTN